MKFGADKIEYENDKIIVTGTTEIGKLKGVWKYREQPVVKYTYFIELSYEKFEKKISENLPHLVKIGSQDESRSSTNSKQNKYFIGGVVVSTASFKVEKIQRSLQQGTSQYLKTNG